MAAGVFPSCCMCSRLIGVIAQARARRHWWHQAAAQSGFKTATSTFFLEITECQDCEHLKYVSAPLEMMARGLHRGLISSKEAAKFFFMVGKRS